MADQHRRTQDGFSRIVTANRLTDGVVVFLCADRRWAQEIAAAAIFPPGGEDGALAAAAAAERARQVVAAYAIDVTVDAHGRPVPRTWRERIRADGPTMPYGADLAVV